MLTFLDIALQLAINGTSAKLNEVTINCQSYLDPRKNLSKIANQLCKIFSVIYEIRHETLVLNTMKYFFDAKNRGETMDNIVKRSEVILPGNDFKNIFPDVIMDIEYQFSLFLEKEKIENKQTLLAHFILLNNIIPEYETSKRFGTFFTFAQLLKERGYFMRQLDLTILLNDEKEEIILNKMHKLVFGELKIYFHEFSVWYIKLFK